MRLRRSRKIQKVSKEDFHKIKSSKLQIIPCSSCGRLVHDVSENAISVLCPICTTLLVPIEEKIKPAESGFPRGWKFFSQFVHADGRVFKRGVEIPELKGTLPPTNLEELKKKYKENRIKRKIKKQQREEKLVKEFENKKIKKTKDVINLLSNEDKSLFDSIKGEIILTVKQSNSGNLIAVDDKNRDFTRIVNNMAKMKYAFSKNKKIIGKKNKNIITWKVK